MYALRATHAANKWDFSDHRPTTDDLTVPETSMSTPPVSGISLLSMRVRFSQSLSYEVSVLTTDEGGSKRLGQTRNPLRNAMLQLRRTTLPQDSTMLEHFISIKMHVKLSSHANPRWFA